MVEAFDAVTGLTNQAKELIKDGNPIKTLGTDCDFVHSGNQNLGSFEALLTQTEELSKQMVTLGTGDKIYGAKLEEVNTMVRNIVESAGSAEGAVGAMNQLVADAKLTEVFATFKELLAYAELVKQLTTAGDDPFGAGCLVKCYADGVITKLEAISSETQALVGQLVGPENQQVFTDLVKNASMLPEQLAGIVQGMQGLPATVTTLVKDVLEEPTTDTTGPISEIRAMLDISRVITALKSLTDGAVDIVKKMAKAVRLVAKYCQDLPGQIVAAFEPDGCLAIPIQCTIGDTQNAKQQLQDGLEKVMAPLGGVFDAVIAAAGKLEEAIGKIDPAPLQAKITEFVDKGLEVLAKILRVATIFGELVDQIEGIHHSFDGSGAQIKANIQVIADKCPEVKAVCERVVEAVANVDDVCVDIFAALKDTDADKLDGCAAQLRTMQSLVHPNGLRTAVVPLGDALEEAIPVQLINGAIRKILEFLHPQTGAPAKLREAMGELEIEAGATVIAKCESISKINGINDIPAIFAQTGDALDRLKPAVDAIEDNCLKPLGHASEGTGTAAASVEEFAKVIRNPAGAAQDLVKGVIGDSLGGINLGGLGGGMFG